MIYTPATVYYRLEPVRGYHLFRLSFPSFFSPFSPLVVLARFLALFSLLTFSVYRASCGYTLCDLSCFTITTVFYDDEFTVTTAVSYF